MGHAVIKAGRCEGIQEIFANEVADEARGAGEAESPSEREWVEFWHSERRFRAGFWHSFGTVA
jgi:hypothetical protein